MKITKNYNEKDLLMSVEGRIDTITSQELDKEINSEIGNFESLTLDFADLEYISSAGLRVLIATQKKLKASDIPLVIKNINDSVREIFRMSGFDKILKIE
ncbi:MAG: STAS domain-containing protein [Methanobrevibacter sp.]|nr:STAS domain-containing protein [Methanobrevibacter sp.]